MDISFRLMTKGDLPLVSNWQMSPEVHQWYGKDNVDTAQIENRYREKMEQIPRLTRHFIIRLDGTDAGMIQAYMLNSYPDFNCFVQMDENTAMVDVFLAPKFMHKGYGSDVMRAFLKNYVFSGRLFVADKCAIGPEPKNLSAIRMYEKAGFHWLKTIQIPDEDAPEYIMIIDRETIMG